MAGKLGSIFVDFIARTANFDQGVGRVRKGANSVGGDLKVLTGVASRVFAGFSAAIAVREMIQAGDAAAKYSGQLALVTKSSEDAAKAHADLFASAQNTRSQFGDSVNLYAKLARATEELNVNHERLLVITETLNKAGVVSAATTQEQSAAIQQLSQGLASGVLRGEELNSVMEQTPRIARAIAEGMGITIGQLREYGKQGKITSEQVIKALESQAAVIDREFQKMPRTVEQATTQLTNSIQLMLAQFSGVNSALIEIIDATRQTVDGFRIMAEWGSTYLVPILTVIGDTANIIANNFYMLWHAFDLNFKKVNELAAENETRMIRIASAIDNYGKSLEDLTPKLEKVVDLGKLLFKDVDEKTKQKNLELQQKLYEANASSIQLASDRLIILNDMWQAGIVTTEAYTEKVKDIARAFEAANDSQYEFIEESNSFYTDWLKRNDSALKAKLAAEQQARWQSVRITQQEVDEKIRLARYEAQQRVQLANSTLMLIAAGSEAMGKRTFKFQKRLAAAQALINAYQAASSAASQSGIGAIAAYIATFAHVIQAYNAIKSTEIGGGGGFAGGATGPTIPTQTLPTQQEQAVTSTGVDKATFIFFTGLGGGLEITQEMANELIDMAANEINNNGRRIMDVDSAQVQTIIQAAQA